MIISKCPLRVSLVGGSTDLQQFIDYYEIGKVISFPCTLYTYITLSTRYDGLYRINYSNTETTNNPKTIKNDIAREVIEYFGLPPVTITFNSDIPTTGSGLASSSSYMVALVEACNRFLQLNLSQFQVCKLAHKIELKINRLTGYQDTVGCGMGGLKMITFKKSGMTFDYIDSNVLKNNNLYLYPTDVSRSSTSILETIDIHKSHKLLDKVELLFNNMNSDIEFNKIMNDSWEIKKSTSSNIITEDLLEVEKELRTKYNIKSVKLCGAGGGGYFLLVTNDTVDNGYKIDVDNVGVVSWTI